MSILIDFAAIRAAVRMEMVLQHYGIGQRRGFALCPFHDDQHPSMRVYRDGFYCFSCGVGGDTINFVARMDGVCNAEAARRVAVIGGLSMPDASDYRSCEVARQSARAQRLERDRKEGLSAEYDRLCAELHVLHGISEREYPFTQAWCRAMRRLSAIEARLDELVEEMGACDV